MSLCNTPQILCPYIDYDTESPLGIKQRIKYLYMLDCCKKIQRFVRKKICRICPVCLESTNFSILISPYQCEHRICVRCERTWRLRGNTCPECRSNPIIPNINIIPDINIDTNLENINIIPNIIPDYNTDIEYNYPELLDGGGEPAPHPENNVLRLDNDTIRNIIRQGINEYNNYITPVFSLAEVLTNIFIQLLNYSSNRDNININNIMTNDVMMNNDVSERLNNRGINPDNHVNYIRNFIHSMLEQNYNDNYNNYNFLDNNNTTNLENNLLNFYNNHVF